MLPVSARYRRHMNLGPSSPSRMLRAASVPGSRQLKSVLGATRGDNLDRPEFIRLQSDMFAGQVKTVIVRKLDRLSRSLRDGIDTLCDWLGKGVPLVSVTQQLDFAGPAGKMIASVLFAVAEMEQQTRREQQTAGIAVAKRNGVYQGRKAGSLKADAARALALRSKGLNDTEIATALGVARRTVQRYLHA